MRHLPALVAAMLTLAMLSPSLARGQAGAAQTPATRYRSPYGGSLYYLQMPQVAKALELVDYQNEQIKKIRDDINTEMRESYAKLSDLPREERTQKYYDLMNELADKAEKKVQDVLVPHQRARLKEVKLQMSLRYNGASGTLAQSDFAEALGITPEQLKQLGEKRTEMYQKLQKEYQRLREQYQQEMLEAVLTAEQLAKLKKLMGEALP